MTGEDKNREAAVSLLVFLNQSAIDESLITFGKNIYWTVMLNTVKHLSFSKEQGRRTQHLSFLARKPTCQKSIWDGIKFWSFIQTLSISFMILRSHLPEPKYLLIYEYTRQMHALPTDHMLSYYLSQSLQELCCFLSSGGSLSFGVLFHITGSWIDCWRINVVSELLITDVPARPQSSKNEGYGSSQTGLMRFSLVFLDCVTRHCSTACRGVKQTFREG